MRVLYIEPLMPPRTINIENTLDAMRTLLHCELIEAVYPFDDLVALICSETGKLDGLPLNRAVGRDIIAGPFLIDGLGEEDFIELPPALIEKYTNLFQDPETFIITVTGVIVKKIKPKEGAK